MIGIGLSVIKSALSAVGGVINLIGNPFTSDVSGWTKLGSDVDLIWVSTGRVELTTLNGAANSRVYTSVTTEVGASYTATVSNLENASNQAQLKIGTSGGASQISSTNVVGTAVVPFTATATTTFITLQNNNSDSTVMTFYDISVV